MANGGNGQSIVATGTATATIYDPAAGDLFATSIFVCARASNTVALSVNAPALHGTNFVGLPLGTPLVFRAGQNGMGPIYAQAASSNGANLDFGICARV